MDQYDKDKPLTSEYYRQIKFNEDIAIHHPDKFMVLKSHGIIIDCEYKHPKDEEFKKKMKGDRLRRYLRKNSQPNCYFLLYHPYLDGSYRDARDELNKNPRLILDFMYQIIDSINIMRKKGYSQNDYGPDNLMYKKKNNKYQWYIIDYGNLCNKSFPESYLDRDIKIRPHYCLDLYQFIMTVANLEIRNMINYFKQHNYERNYPSFKQFIENVKNEPEYKIISSQIPKSIKNENLLNGFINLYMRMLYPKIYMKSNNVPKEVYENYKSPFPYSDLLIYCLKHYDDETYDDILIKIKEVMMQTTGGYYDKYVKYKSKYLQFKGGTSNKIILITGPSGSGKTTLGNKIKNKFKNTLVIDSDEIHDNIFLDLYENNKKFKNMVNNNTGNPREIHDKIAIKKRDEIIKNNKDKTIFFIGFTISLDDLDHIGYFIDLPIDVNFRRVAKRTLHDICDNSKELEKMYDSIPPNAVKPLALFKYKIRRGFPLNYNANKNYIERMRKDALDKNYKIMSSDEILEDLKVYLDL